MNDTIDQITVRYYATFRETGRRCEVSLVQLLTPGAVTNWTASGWEVSTVAQADPVPVFGTLTCVGVDDARSELARVKIELERMRMERDEWRASSTFLGGSN